MAYSATTKKGRERLAESVRQSRKYLAPFRINRHSHIREYVGTYYSNNGAKKAVPKNIIDQMHTVLVTELASNNPRAKVLTRKRHLRGEAFAREFVLNDEIRRIGLAKANRIVASETLFAGIGIVAVGLAQYGGNDGEGGTQTYVSPIDFDDWVHDTSTPWWSDVEFEGHRYSVNKKEALKSGLYDEAKIRKAMAAEYSVSDEYGNERVSSIMRDEDKDGGSTEFKKKLHLVDLFFPRDKKLCTFLASPCQDIEWVIVGEPIREVDWIGPPGGPYHKLIFKDVPANTMGKSMIGDIRSLHNAINGLYRKYIKDAINAKSVFAYSGAASNDASRIQRSRDGDYIRMDHGPDAAKMHRFDSTNPNHVAVASYLNTAANEMGGNFALLGGMGAQTDTLGQDRLLHQSASRMVDDMQERIEGFVRNIVEDVAFYMFDDPDLYRDVTYDIPNTGLSVQQPLTAESLQGKFNEFEFQIEVHSMRPKSPMQRIADMDSLLQSAMQFAQMGMLDQQGMSIDVKGYLETKSNYLGADIEWQNMMVTADEPLAVEGRPHERSMPTETKRTYERISKSGMTQPGAEQKFQQDMFTAAKGMNGDAA